MLLVFLGLLFFLLFLVAMAVHFGRPVGLFKNLPIVVIALSALVIPGRALAQTTSPDQSLPATPPANEPLENVGPPETAGPPAALPETEYERPISWKLMFHNWVDDQKQIWSFPARVTKHRNWIPTAAVLGATAGLFFVDKHEAAIFPRHDDIS